MQCFLSSFLVFFSFIFGLLWLVGEFYGAIHILVVYYKALKSVIGMLMDITLNLYNIFLFPVFSYISFSTDL